jgi:hypothetical protein
MMDLSNIPTRDLIKELNRRDHEMSINKVNLKTRYDKIFKFDVYKITNVVTPNERGNPRVGELHRCTVTPTGLVSMDEKLRGYYYVVEGEVVEEKQSFKEYILNLDPDTIVSHDLPYYEKYHRVYVEENDEGE